MDIKEKMEMVLPSAVVENKVLSNDEKKVLAALIYSYGICKNAKDNIIIRSINSLRKDVGMGLNRLYDAIKCLEFYHMIERECGKRRTAGQPSIATKFKLIKESIENPPEKPIKLNFFDKLKNSENIMSYVDIDIVKDTVTDIDIVTETNIDINTETDVEKVIDRDTVTDKVINLKTKQEKNNNTLSPDNLFIDKPFIEETVVVEKSKKEELSEVEKESITSELSQWQMYLNEHYYNKQDRRES